ncbi:MAG TPA: hypothetical protein VIW24_24465 [Aldersonia sp.]
MARSPFDLHGQVAVDSGIGLAMADALAAAESDVCIWGRDPERNKAAETKLAQHGMWGGDYSVC